MVLDELGSAAFRYNDTGQSDYPRNVVNLNQTMDAPSDDDMRTFVGSACEEALLERRRRHLMTSRKLSFSLSWIKKRLDVTAHELLSRVMGVASRSRGALPLPEVALRETDPELRRSSMLGKQRTACMPFHICGTCCRK